jgi:formylglycine-generating enzyme required for sulfatase activity
VGTGPKEGIGGGYRDMSGVVWEWVDTDHVVAGETGQAIAGKVLKGGSWLEGNPADRRAATRRYEKTDNADADSGFRCAATAAAWPDAEYWLSQHK